MPTSKNPAFLPLAPEATRARSRTTTDTPRRLSCHAGLAPEIPAATIATSAVVRPGRDGKPSPRPSSQGEIRRGERLWSMGGQRRTAGGARQAGDGDRKLRAPLDRLGRRFET